MGSTPVDPHEWATSDSAVKSAYPAQQLNFGWTSPTDKVSISSQNYWQNSVGQWVTFFSNNLETVADTTNDNFWDLWEWTTGRLKEPLTVDPYVGIIGTEPVTGNALTWFSNYDSLSSQWEDYRPDNLAGARYWELIDMFNRGLAIQIVDQGGSEWTIWAPNGCGKNDIIMLNSLSINQDVRIAIQPTDTNPNIKIRRVSNGVTSFPLNFLSFGTMSQQLAFDNRNPNGIRVGLYGSENLFVNGVVPTSTKPRAQITADLNIKKKWIRPLNQSNSYDMSNDVIFDIDLVVGRGYRMDVLCQYDSAPGILFWDCDNIPFAQNTEATRKTQRMVTTNRAIGTGLTTWNMQGVLATPTFSTDINSIYGYGNFYTNYIIIEEMN